MARRGRPPLGERAMTEAERKRRQRALLRDKQPVPKMAARDPETDSAPLALTAQKRLEAAIRAHQRKLDLEFEVRCREDCQRWLNEVGLPQYLKELTKLEHSISNRDGIMSRATFNAIRRALHPDSRNSISDKMLGAAFDAFMALEKRVLDEKQSPTQFRTIPRTYEELMAMKAKVQERVGKSAPSVR